MVIRYIVILHYPFVFCKQNPEIFMNPAIEFSLYGLAWIFHTLVCKAGIFVGMRNFCFFRLESLHFLGFGHNSPFPPSEVARFPVVPAFSPTDLVAVTADGQTP